jgi:hypothetical protein
MQLPRPGAPQTGEDTCGETIRLHLELIYDPEIVKG